MQLLVNATVVLCIKVTTMFSNHDTVWHFTITCTVTATKTTTGSYTSDFRILQKFFKPLNQNAQKVRSDPFFQSNETRQCANFQCISIQVMLHHPPASPGLFLSTKNQSCGLIHFFFSLITILTIVFVSLFAWRRGNSLKTCPYPVSSPSIKEDVRFKPQVGFDFLSECWHSILFQIVYNINHWINAQNAQYFEKSQVHMQTYSQAWYTYTHTQIHTYTHTSSNLMVMVKRKHNLQINSLDLMQCLIHVWKWLNFILKNPVQQINSSGEKHSHKLRWKKKKRKKMVSTCCEVLL